MLVKYENQVKTRQSLGWPAGLMAYEMFVVKMFINL